MAHERALPATAEELLRAWELRPEGPLRSGEAGIVLPVRRADGGGVADAARIVRRRFDLLTEMLHLDRERAARWTMARLLQNALGDIEDGEPAIAPAATVIEDALRSAGWC